jgi:hypothetical protein
MILMSLALVLRREPVTEIVPSFVGNPGLVLVTAIITLVAGLAIVLVHNRWTGGARTIIVTLIGWLLLVRAMVLLILPLRALADIVTAARADQFIYVYAAVWAVLGVFLVWPRTGDPAIRAE